MGRVKAKRAEKHSPRFEIISSIGGRVFGMDFDAGDPLIEEHWTMEVCSCSVDDYVYLFDRGKRVRSFVGVPFVIPAGGGVQRSVLSDSL
jgi:hypothetical protein